MESFLLESIATRTAISILLFRFMQMTSDSCLDPSQTKITFSPLLTGFIIVMDSFLLESIATLTISSILLLRLMQMSSDSCLDPRERKIVECANLH